MALALMALPPDLDPKVGTPEMALAGGLGVVRHSGGLDMRSQGALPMYHRGPATVTRFVC